MDKLLLLLSDSKTIYIYDCFTKTCETLIEITSPQFTFSVLEPVNNFIYNWLPLKDHILVLARNTKPQSRDRMYICTYDGRMIASHSAVIDSSHGY